MNEANMNNQIERSSSDKNIGQKTMESASPPIHNIRAQDPQTLQELIGIEAALEEKRVDVLKNAEESISSIQNRLQTLKAEVRGDFTMEIRDADYYRVSMFQLESKISQLKESFKVELFTLIREEQDIYKELQGMDRRVEDWSKPLNSRIFKPISNSAYRRSSSQEENDNPTTEFQRYISSTGGHTGGWEEQDHLLFLRERRKYNAKRKFITMVQSLLPDISEDQIVAHENWYQRYENLKQGQKEAIRKWREHKLSVRDQYLEPPNDEKEAAERNRPKNPGYQRDIAGRIKEWKRQQMIRKEEEEELKREEKERQHEERLKQKELQFAKKTVVDQYKAEKLSKLQAELLAQQMKELQALEDRARKSVLLKTFREQDQQYIEKKKFQRCQTSIKEKERTERLEKAKPSIDLTVERDPQRVLKPTEVWNQHCVMREDNSAPKPVIHLRSVPHLAVPSWRKGLNNI